MSEFKNLPQDLSQYPILQRDLIIDISDEVPVPKHRIRVFSNTEEFVAGHGKTLNEAILDLVTGIQSLYEPNMMDTEEYKKKHEKELKDLGIMVD